MHYFEITIDSHVYARKCTGRSYKLFTQTPPTTAFIPIVQYQNQAIDTGAIFQLTEIPLVIICTHLYVCVHMCVCM